jgi:MutS domain V
MKAFLMFRDRDFDPAGALFGLQETRRWRRDRNIDLESAPAGTDALLAKDLELDTLFLAMANKDQLVFDVAQKAMLTSPSNDLATIKYRQGALKDCLVNPETIRMLYGLTDEAFQRQRKVWPRMREYPTGTLDHSVEIMAIFVDVLKRLRAAADKHSPRFKSEAFSNLFATLARELDDNYFALINRHLKLLKFRNGVLVSVGLAKGLKGGNYVLRRPLKPLGNRLTRIFGEHRPAYRLYLAPRDEAGAQAMSELRDRGLGLAADALAKSAEHILSFLQMLQTELAFYVGCLNLRERLLELGGLISFPLATEHGVPRFSCMELYDVCLALTMNKRPVGNEVVAHDKSLVIVTGANQGGKSTFLRSVGLAQLMMESGMFVAAARLEANVVSGVFTHFKREEDATMKSGKFDEELSRMNDIINAIASHALILFNESFAATNEREGSEIARQIVSALLERMHKVVFVSHQYDFAHGFYAKRLDTALFLRAQRELDGQRTFKLIEGEPLSTSFGQDVYREVFQAGDEAPPSEVIAVPSPPTQIRAAQRAQG